VLDEFDEASRGAHLDIGHGGCLGPILGWQIKGPVTALSHGDRGADRSWNGTEAPIEAELTEKDIIFDSSSGDDLEEDKDSDG